MCYTLVRTLYPHRLSMDGTNTLTVMATTLIKKGKPIKFNYVKVKNKAGFKGLSHQTL